MPQPKPKQMTKEKKKEKVEFFKQKIEEYPVVGILDMHNLPAKQLQEIKKDMKEFAEVKMSRTTLMEIAVNQSDKKGVEKLKDNQAIQPAFIFSKKDPFQLYSLIQENKTSAAAQGGETAPNNIEIPDGDTGIGPGPMLGKLQQAGANVNVEDGSIHVESPTTIVEKGEIIDNETAEILNQLGIEPLEIGLDLDIALSEGELFQAAELDIDTEEYKSKVEKASSLAMNLAVNAEIVNQKTASSIIGQAVQKAENLSINEGLPEEETIEKTLSLARSRAEKIDGETN